MKPGIVLAVVILFLLVLASGCHNPSRITASPPAVRTSLADRHPGTGEGIHKIQHVIIIMQENRAFDEYFGTYPGADGIPMANGTPAVCVPDPDSEECVRPYHDPRDVNFGGPHSQYESEADINGGKMDGFIEQAEIAINNTCTRLRIPGNASVPVRKRPRWT